jgi:hypothetical protein
MYISLVIIYTKYTGWCQNDFNVRAYNRHDAAHDPDRAHQHRAGLAVGGEVVLNPLYILYRERENREENVH